MILDVFPERFGHRRQSPAVALKLTKLLPTEMELGAYQINKFMSTNLAFAILVARVGGTIVIATLAMKVA